MASVFRQDTGELLGSLTSLEGPLADGITYWPFNAWRHSDGKLHSEPEAARNERELLSPDTLRIGARFGDAAAMPGVRHTRQGGGFDQMGCIERKAGRTGGRKLARP